MTELVQSVSPEQCCLPTKPLSPQEVSARTLNKVKPHHAIASSLCVCGCLSVFLFLSVCACMLVWTVCVCTCVFVCLNVSVYMPVCICVCIYMYICVYSMFMYVQVLPHLCDSHTADGGDSVNVVCLIRPALADAGRARAI